MVFVNEIGEIVHGIVDKFSGSANKNIGDAFLLVWKFPNEDIVINEQEETIWLKPNHRVHQVCDMSVISFIKIISTIKKSQTLVKYQ